DELGRNFSKALPASFRPAILDRHRAPVDPTELAQSLHERAGPKSPAQGRARAEEADSRQRLYLLRAHCQRPRGHRAAEQRDELASPDHSITSSARPSSIGGTSRPIAFAALRLITSSNLVGCSTGNSPGLAPLRILSTYTASRS